MNKNINTNITKSKLDFLIRLENPTFKLYPYVDLKFPRLARCYTT